MLIKKYNYLNEKIQFLLSKGSQADIISAAALMVALLGNSYTLVALVIILALLELPKISNRTNITLCRNRLLFLLPLAYAVNIGLGASIGGYYYAVAALAILLSIMSVGFKSLRSRLFKRRIIAANLSTTVRQHANKTFKLDKALMLHLIFLLALALEMRWPAISLALLILLALVLLAHMLMMLKNRYQAGHEDDSVVNRLREYSPDFAVFFSIGKTSQNIYMMWDEYFKMVKRPFVVVTPQQTHLQELQKLTDTPVVYSGNTVAIERILGLPSIKAVFYSSNSPTNMLALLATAPNHVHIGHGDSDKAPSYRSVNGMYDKIFVAGQEAVDRYKNHGVLIPKDKFMIVGRPQVDRVAPKARSDIKTVLYAPTWQGDVEYTDYSSLYLGKKIVHALLNKKLRVIFRPHPNSYTSPRLTAAINDINSMLEKDAARSGLKHVYGQQAELVMSVFDCFNESDTLISDVSSVTSDYLYSEKPIVLIAMKESQKEFIKNNPVARAAYVVEKDLSGLDTIIGSLVQGKDELQTQRSNLKDRYLSKAKPGKLYSDLFVSAVQEMIDQPNPRNHAADRNKSYGRTDKDTPS